MEQVSLLTPFTHEEHETQNKLLAQGNTRLYF